MKKMKCLLVVLLLLAAMIGCGHIKMDMGVDESKNAFLRYEITCDLAGLDAAQKTRAIETLTNLNTHYALNGFTLQSANLGTDETIITIAFEKKRTCNSYAEAFDALQEMLLDANISPFLQLDMQKYIGEYEMAFSFFAETDISQILSTAHTEQYPPDLRTEIEASVQGVTGEICLTLPATEAVEGDFVLLSEASLAQTTVPISLIAPTQIELSTRLSVENGMLTGDIQDSLLRLRADRHRDSIILGVAAFLLLLCILLFILILLKWKKRKLSLLGKSVSEGETGDIAIDDVFYIEEHLNTETEAGTEKESIE